MTIEIPPGLLPPDDSSLPYRDPALTLGQRCLVWIEMQRAAPWQHIPPAPHPNTNERVRSWFRPAMRNGRPLGLTEGNWCAVFQSAALFACALGPHELIHGYRAAVVELIADTLDEPGKRAQLQYAPLRSAGRYHTVADVKAGKWSPQRGDLVIFDRRTPGKPETNWQRHVSRFEWWTSPEWTSFYTVGGNENRRIMRQLRTIDDPKLLGFLSYYVPPQT